MFTQVLGIMTSFLFMSQSKERPFVLHSQAIFSHSTSLHQFTMAQARSYHRAKKFLTEDVILPELLSDNLSNVPEDTFNDSGSDSDDSVREKLCAQNKVTVSQTTSEESDDSDDTSNAGATPWLKEDKRPNL
jgi:hypothetical protein